jgi:AcrR family transcriptional regulator
VRVPVQARSRQTREQIVTAGRAVFARNGYQRAGVKEIARAAGVAVGSFYAYFPDKQALFLEITEGYYQEIFARIRSQPFSSPDQSRDERTAIVGTMIQALYDAHDIEPELHRELQLMLLAGGASPGGNRDHDRDTVMHRVVRERVDAMDREVQAWLTEIVRNYAPSRDAETAAAVIFRSAEETIHRLKFFPETMPPAENVIAELSNMLSAYLFTG